MARKELKFSNSPAVLGGIILSASQALDLTLAALAERHANQPGQWLDDLEREVIRTIKGATTDHIAIETEYEAVSAGLAVVADRFEALRRSLDAGRDDNPSG